MTALLLQSRIANRKSQILAWQGWTIEVPTEWNPVKVDGDGDEGALLLADLHSARLGLRWKRTARRTDPAGWAKRAMVDEVGKLAAEEAVDFAFPDVGDAEAATNSPAHWAVSKLYRDPAPPGRDVWVGQSRRSGRVLEIVHHAADHGRRFADSILPSLTDAPADQPRQWSIFDLCFQTPPGVAVRWYRFNAGDLSVGLAGVDGKIIVVRQVGPAGLALSRQPLARWLSELQASTRKIYRPIDTTELTTLDVGGRTLDGVRGLLRRKRRLWWAWMIAAKQTVLAIHDPTRDRLLIGQAIDETALRQTLATVGWNAVPTAAAGGFGDEE